MPDTLARYPRIRPKRWSLFSAMAIFGAHLPSAAERRRQRNEGTLIGGKAGRFVIPPRCRPVPADELMPGGPDYVYETAKDAYRRAVQSAHPDHGGSTEQMQLVNDAWAYIERRWNPRRREVNLAEARRKFECHS